MIKSNLGVLIAKKERDTGERWPYRRIAEVTGIHKDTISKFVRGEMKYISLKDIDTLCGFLECPPGPVPLLLYDHDSNKSEQ